MSLFAKEKINKGRQLEIDALKAICIVCMIFIHVMEDCVGSGAMESTQVSQAMDKIGVVVGAAAFMFCMGIGMRYARNQSAKAYVIRGIAIITVGQMLNLLRNVLFNITAYWITNEQWFLANSFLVIQADILSFAGLAFLLIALLRKLNLPDGDTGDRDRDESDRMGRTLSDASAGQLSCESDHRIFLYNKGRIVFPADELLCFCGGRIPGRREVSVYQR